jgi:hypothetical protein
MRAWLKRYQEQSRGHVQDVLERLAPERRVEAREGDEAMRYSRCASRSHSETSKTKNTMSAPLNTCSRACEKSILSISCPDVSIMASSIDSLDWANMNEQPFRVQILESKMAYLFPSTCLSRCSKLKSINSMMMVVNKDITIMMRSPSNIATMTSALNHDTR